MKVAVPTSNLTFTGCQFGGESCQLWIVSLMNLTEPSAKQKFAPPGWKLDAEIEN